MKTGVSPRFAFAPLRAGVAGVPSSHGAAGGGDSLRLFFGKNRGPLVGLYALLTVENSLRVLQPLAIGLAINGLLTESYAGLLWFMGQHLLHLLVQSFRQRFEQRAFVRLATDAGRFCASWSGLDLFERQLPQALAAAVSILGATTLLAWFDWALIPFCLLLLIPSLLLSSADSPLMHRGEGGTMAGEGEESMAEELPLFDFGSLASRRSTEAGAVRVSLMQLFVLATLVAVLIRFCTHGMPEPGSIFAVFCYVLVLAKGLGALPGAVAGIVLARDFARRAGR